MGEVRPIAWSSWFWLMFLASCSFDVGGLPSSADDASSATDAAPSNGNVDARVVGCASDDDCATPPDLCHVAGTCAQNNTCQYAAVDCSSSDGTCTAGECNPSTGWCTQVAANEGTVCDAPLVGDWSDCYADNTCGSDGQRQRPVTARICSSGMCTDDEPGQETESCVISAQDIYGAPCGPFSCADYDDCEAPFLADQCTTDGERVRDCTGKTCNIVGNCTVDNWSEATSCVLDTDGDDCFGCWNGGTDCVCAGGSCVADGT